MFGHSGLFGDYAEIIHALGGRLAKVVVNVPDVAHAHDRPFADRLADVNAWLARTDAGYSIESEHIDQFRPGAQERYVIGFRGVQLCPLRDRLRSTFGLIFDSLVHPSAVVASSAVLDEGVIVNPGSVVASLVRLGEFSLVNRGATIGHDAQIGAFANIGPGANLASSVRVGCAAVVGIGATVIEHLAIGEGALVAAGSVVTREVAPGMVVAGVPARAIRKRDATGGA
jgi:sugar O-acyltransferase (sialic acid O-acetyltransferase NeuD family)